MRVPPLAPGDDDGKGLAPTTVRKVKALLSAMFATAVEDGAIRTNPAAGVRKRDRTLRETPDDERLRVFDGNELMSMAGDPIGQAERVRIVDRDPPRRPAPAGDRR